MEYCDSGDLLQLITMYKKADKLMPEEDCWKMVIQIIKGLYILHKNGIMHRDIKAGNVFLFKDGIVKLGDLNVAKTYKQTDFFKTQTGTPYYSG